MTAIPSSIWRTLSYPVKARQLPKGLDAPWDYVRGTANRFNKRARAFLRRADAVLRREGEFADFADARLRNVCDELRTMFRLGREMPEDVNRALAVVREIAYRQLGEHPFRVQIAGALAASDGCIAEMATGEGKTLVAALAATLAGWRGRGCHVITVNDYLAQRDAEWMRPIYQFCGLTVAHIQQESPPVERRRAYHADITYCTNKEVTADFLRDSLLLGRRRSLADVLLDNIVGDACRTDRLVLRGLQYAIVDEADSVLLDEAVTPLIISGSAPNAEQVEAFTHASELAAQLASPQHYTMDRRFREIELTKSGKRVLSERTATLGGIWTSARRSEELVNQALVAREFFIRDKQYVIQDGKVVIVDESTGRLMPDRTWRGGLHQAIEAKEELEINPPKSTFARISFQRFFRMYRKLAGLTGTAVEGRREFWRVYGLPVVVIPTNRPLKRNKLPDRCFATAESKWEALVAEIRRVHETGRPVLIGTRNVRDSEHLSELLSAESLDHQVLNAVRHEDEAQIIAQAGQCGAITVATNMAGRGTDIRLGRGMAELGGLHVIAAERHAAGRIDRQLYGRSGRQGDPGSAVAFVSLEDELVTRYVPTRARLTRLLVSARNGHTGSQFTRSLFRLAQRRAEHLAFAQRKAVLRADDWLDDFLGFAGQRF
ncbi:MAG: preprotein translocase subunit SecA [Planctomycetota bacterium]|jgi:preprotein translocase subunit SecA